MKNSMASDSLKQLHAADATSSDLLVGILADICRDNGTGKTNTKSTDDSANIQLSHVITSAHGTSSLDNTADNEDDVGEEQRHLAAEFISKIERAHGAEEAACLEDGDDVALNAGMFRAVPVESKAVVERVHRQDAADESSVPSKQHAAEGGDRCEEVGASILYDVVPYFGNVWRLHCGDCVWEGCQG